jgi:hypothetical protein
MTQELVLAGLLSGLIGLLWVMTIAIGESKHAVGQAHESDPSGNSEEPHGESALKHHTMAA